MTHCLKRQRALEPGRDERLWDGTSEATTAAQQLLRFSTVPDECLHRQTIPPTALGFYIMLYFCIVIHKWWVPQLRSPAAATASTCSQVRVSFFYLDGYTLSSTREAARPWTLESSLLASHGWQGPRSWPPMAVLQVGDTSAVFWGYFRNRCVLLKSVLGLDTGFTWGKTHPLRCRQLYLSFIVLKESPQAGSRADILASFCQARAGSSTERGAGGAGGCEPSPQLLCCGNTRLVTGTARRGHAPMTERQGSGRSFYGRCYQGEICLRHETKGHPLLQPAEGS